MVNLGPSRGCQTCKKRRVKCDEGKPICQRCIRAGRECGGYAKKELKIRFKAHKPDGKPPQGRLQTQQQQQQILELEETESGPASRVDSPTKSGRSSKSTSPKPRWTLSPLPPPSPKPPAADVAVSWYLWHFARKGRSFSSSRGFFEMMEPMLAKERPGSPLSLSVTVMATKMMKLWSTRRSPFEIPTPDLAAAFAGLQHAVRDPTLSRRPGTVMAALVLQLHDNLAAVYGLRRANRVHHEGAAALLLHQDESFAYDPFGRRMLSYTVHSEVSSAMRLKHRVPPWVERWLPPVRLAAAGQQFNPSERLDIIGVTVANLQHSFYRVWELTSRGDAGADADMTAIANDLCAGIAATEARLLSWRDDDMPRYWWPVRLPSIKRTDPPMLTYMGTIDVYPTIQIAAIWNTWRSYRLSLFCMLLAFYLCPQFANCKVRRPGSAGDDGSGGAGKSEDDDAARRASHAIQDNIQELFDDMCRSFPFHIGNRLYGVGLDELTDTRIALPSLFDLDHESRQPYLEVLSEENINTHADQQRHAISTGAWHVMAPVSYLVGLFDEPFGVFLEQVLRPGQRDWVRQQLVRTINLMQLTKAEGVGGQGGRGDRGGSTSGPGAENGGGARQAVVLGETGARLTGVDVLAQMIREGLVLSSGS